ncbi:MAG: hypothetical protein ACE5NC_10220 [Anaerolineae bacterium]
MSPELRRAIALGAIVGGLVAAVGVVALRGRRLPLDRSSLREFMRLVPTIIGVIDRLSEAQMPLEGPPDGPSF